MTTKRWTNIGKDWWTLRESAISTLSQRKKLSLTNLRPPSKTKKARDKFKKGPLKIQLVLETIELDNYNRKNGDEKLRNKEPRKDSTNTSSEDEQIGHTNQTRKRKPTFLEKRKFSNRNCRFWRKPNWSLEHICPARRSQCNKCKTMGHFAKVCKSKIVKRISEAPSSGSNTESWPEIDHIQSVNGINRVDFYKAILLVQGQPIEFIIYTGSPVTIIPPIIKPTEIKKTTKNVLVAIDRFSKWPTAHICRNADTQTVIKFLTKYFADNGTPRCIRTDNGSCFESNVLKNFFNSENIKRIRCTPNLHTGTGLVERTIRTIKLLTRANMTDGLIFDDSVQLAIKTFRQTPHSKLNMTLFQMHFGRKPGTAITNLIGNPECLLSY